MAQETFLNDVWTLYFHDPYDNAWDEKSYHILHTISTVEDFARIGKAYSSLWEKGMFFLMREHIRPMWEDPYNIKGGCFSFKVMKPELPERWYRMCSTLLGETMVRDVEDQREGGRSIGNASTNRESIWNQINGISISPKRNYSIVRVWVADEQYGRQGLYQMHVPVYTELFFKVHVNQKDFVAPSEKEEQHSIPSQPRLA